VACRQFLRQPPRYPPEVQQPDGHMRKLIQQKLLEGITESGMEKAATRRSQPVSHFEALDNSSLRGNPI